MVQVSDPAGDLETLGNAELAARFQSVDLINVAVAVAGNRLCVDFTAAAPPAAQTFYIIYLDAPASTTGGSVAINVDFLSGGTRQAVLKYPGVDEAPNRGVVPARVAVRGHSTSLIIDRGALPGFTPFPAFGWSAKAVGQTGLRSPQQVADYAPDNQTATYP